jgi:regulator of nonsense transcripts 2
MSLDSRQKEWEAKLSLRQQNLSPRAPLSLKLDSNLKKTSALVRKVKIFAESHKDASLFSDLEKLNLVKFVEEIATSLADTKLGRVSDIQAAVKFASIMHQKYELFAKILEGKVVANLEELLGSCCAGEMAENLNNASRIRSLLRLYGELLIVGVFGNGDKIAELVKKAIVKEDWKDSQFIVCSILATFLKNSGEEFTGVVGTKQKADEAVLGITHLNRPDVVRLNVRADFLQACKKYYDKACQELNAIFQEIKKQQRINKKVEFYKGSVNEPNIAKVKELGERFERLQQNILIIGDSLELSIPDLSLKQAIEDVEEEKPESETKVDSTGVFDASKAIFEDPEARAFYEVLPALKLILPAVLFEESGGKVDLIGPKPVPKKSAPQQKSKLVDVNVDNRIDDFEFFDDDYEEEPTVVISSDDTASSSPFDVLLKSLMDVASKSDCDKLAEQFCYLSNKSTKKRLLEFLLNSNKFRNDVLPFYARIIATLSQCFSVRFVFA